VLLLPDYPKPLSALAAVLGVVATVSVITTLSLPANVGSAVQCNLSYSAASTSVTAPTLAVGDVLELLRPPLSASPS